MRSKIIQIIEEVLFLESGTITEETLIEDIEEWDSLAHVMILGELEEKLNISIALDEAVSIKSVKELFEKAGV